MHETNSSPPAPPVQYELAIDAAPPKVRRYGLRDAHVRPLVSRGKRGGVFGSELQGCDSGSLGLPKPRTARREYVASVDPGL